MRPRPFGRALAMMAEIAAIYAQGLDFAARQVALGEIDPYRSRGKGLGRYPGSRRPGRVALAQRAARKARNIRKAKR